MSCLAFDGSTRAWAGLPTGSLRLIRRVEVVQHVGRYPRVIGHLVRIEVPDELVEILPLRRGIQQLVEDREWHVVERVDVIRLDEFDLQDAPGRVVADRPDQARRDGLAFHPGLLPNLGRPGSSWPI